MALVNNIENIKINSGNGDLNNISQNKVITPDSNDFSEIYNSLLKTTNYRNGENDKNSINCYGNFCNIAMKSSEINQSNIDSAKIQAKIELDINRLAKLMGIGPKTLMSVMGELKVDPNNYDFKIQTNIDEAVNSVAAYFNISPMTMLAVFKKLDIDPNDLDDKKQVGKIISKLQEFFKLDAKQEKELYDIISKFVREDK